ncbi:MAG TPA: hypothetical protein VJG30_00745 [Candidatus Nanoarchaeia archaeon]|nr:hypothetical protein [Candidatus Nanoarchaeia archaeon]
MISNASPLIILAKTDLMKEFLELYSTIEISPEVCNEAINKGLEAGKQDAQILDALLKEEKIKIVKLNQEYGKTSKKIVENYKLDKGEAETISLALQLKNKEILMDEAMGRKIAKFLNLKPKGTLKILLELYNKKIISEEQLRKKVNEVIGVQFRLDAEVLNKFWELFEKMKTKK